MDKKKQLRIGNIVIKDMKRFGIAIGILVALIIIIGIIIATVINSGYNENNISSANAKKYSNEILNKYETKEMKQEFINNYIKVQNAVGMYIMNNTTTEEGSFDNIILKLRKVLKSNNWEVINIEKPDLWNGEWQLDQDGNVKFKFSIKDIEPNWVKDIDISSKIILN